MATRVTGEIKWVGPKLDELPPEQRAYVIDQLARILADALVADFKANPPDLLKPIVPPVDLPTKQTDAVASPWLTVRQAAARAQISPKVIYGAVRSGRLRAVHVGGKRTLRFRSEYIDEWLEYSTHPIAVQR